MEEWRRSGWQEVLMTDLEALLSREYLLRKIENPGL